MPIFLISNNSYCFLVFFLSGLNKRFFPLLLPGTCTKWIFGLFESFSTQLGLTYKVP